MTKQIHFARASLNLAFIGVAWPIRESGGRQGRKGKPTTLEDSLLPSRSSGGETNRPERRSRRPLSDSAFIIIAPADLLVHTTLYGAGPTERPLTVFTSNKFDPFDSLLTGEVPLKLFAPVLCVFHGCHVGRNNRCLNGSLHE